MKKESCTYGMVLASASPRRKELMAQAGYRFIIIPAKGEERITSTHPAEVVEELSSQKALEVANRILRGESSPDLVSEKRIVVIGADTVVAVDHRILGKPADTEDARRMITEIQGTTHQVYTGVAIVCLDRVEEAGRSWKKDLRVFHECTDVHVFPMSEEEITGYILTKEPYDKAGAYGIQGAFGVYIEGISGDYNNVVGLPIARLYHVLREIGC